MSLRLLLIVPCVLWAGSVWHCTAVARGDEPIYEFLQALREKSMFDMADIYLDRMARSPQTPAEFKERIPVERAENLIQRSATVRNLSARLEQLRQAETVLDEFLKGSQNQQLVAQSTLTLANLKYNQAQCLMAQGRSERITATEKTQLLDEARVKFQECVEGYAVVKKQLADQVRALEEQAKVNPRFSAELRRKYHEYTQIRFRSPLVTEFSADTFPPGDPQQQKLLQAAIEEYDKVAADYPTKKAGVDSLINSARCHNKLQQPAEALKKLADLLNADPDPRLRATRKQAMLVAIESWRQTEPYPFRDVVGYLESVVADLDRAEQREEEWAQIQLELARAYRMKAQDADASNVPAGEVGKLNRSAALFAKRAARSSGPTRDVARQVLADWNINLNDNSEEAAAVTTFAEAKSQALDLAFDMDERYSAFFTRQQKIKADGGAAEDPELAQLRSELLTASQATLSMVQTAVGLSDETVTPGDLNHLRYLQALCFFMQDRYYEPLIIGEYLLSRRPQIEWSRQAAGLAVRSAIMLFEQATSEEKPKAQSKLVELCERVSQRWPGSKEGDMAAKTAINLALASNDKETVERLTSKMSADAANRGGISLRLAQQAWVEFKNNKRKLSSAEQQAEADSLRQRAREIGADLQQGLTNFSSDNVTFEAAYSALYLVDALLEAGDVPAAVQQLEDAPVAPLDLIKQKHPAIMESPNALVFQQSTYRSAVNAYLGALRSGQNVPQWIAKTQGVLAANRELSQQLDSAESTKQLNLMYRLVAAELREQFVSLNNVAERERLAQNLGQFMEGLRKSATDGPTQVWVATTLHDTVEALTVDAAPTEISRELSRQAVEAFEAALKAPLNDLDLPADQVRWELRRRKALARAGAGDFSTAVKEFQDLLTEKNALSLQIDAAKVLTTWGQIDKNKKALEEAMMGSGSRTDPKTKRPSKIIWGWRTLFAQTRGKPEFIDSFHEATLNLVSAQWAYGQLTGEQRALEAARAELTNAQTRDPELGGAKFKSRYLKLQELTK